MRGCGPARAVICLLPAMLAIAAGADGVKADLSPGKIQSATSAYGLDGPAVSAADALAHYSAALQFEAAGKLRQALEHYLAVFKNDPANAALADHTAGIAMQFQGRDAAVKILEEAARANPRSPAPLLNLARFVSTYPPEDLFAKDDRAAKALTEALRKFPAHAEVYEAAVMQHLIQGERNQAVAVMQQALEQPSRDPQFWLATGRVAARVWPLGQAEFAVEYRQHVSPFFENALKHVSKKDAEAVTMEVAQHYLLSNETDRARQLCQELVAKYESLEARKLLFRLHTAADQKDKALATLEEIVRQAPDDAEQQRLLASEYDKRKQPEKAIPHLEAAIQYGGGEINDYVRLGWDFYQTRKFDDMVRVGRRSARLFPDHPLVHYQLAIAHRAREEWAAAVARFAQAEKLGGSTQRELLDHLFYYQYGVTLERMERYDDASRMLEKSVTLTPREESRAAANTLNFLGYMWLEQGRRLDKAGECIRKANELLPEQPAYIDSLGWFHFKKGNYAAALKELQHAETLLSPVAPEDAEILEHIGLVHQALGDKTRALEYLGRADALNTPDVKAHKRIRQELDQLKSGKTGTEK